MRRPKIEVFAECFPGNINFGDVDGEVEIGKFFCQLEWKSGGSGNIPTGQRIKFERYTRMKNGNVVIVVEGDAETMVVSRYCYFWGGKQRRWRDASLDDIQDFLRRWVSHISAEQTA